MSSNQMPWVSFHTHTTHSHADGFGPVYMHVDRVAELGMGAVAFTEHGNANSWPDGERRCREHGIKFIPGVEAYFAPPGQLSKFHITLIAMNEEGLRNLNAIITQSWLDFYKYPTVTWENLKEHNRGIAVTSGCADSLISCSLLGGKSLGPKRLSFTDEQVRKTRRKLQRFLDVFEDRFYLEVQRFPGLPRSCVLNPQLARFSADLKIPLLATADVHYPFPQQNVMQRLLHASRRGSTIAVADAEWEYDIVLTYPQSITKLSRDLIRTGLPPSVTEKAIANTVTLAERCNVELPKAKPLRFGLKPGELTKNRFKKEIKDGLAYRIDQRPEIKDRIKDYEKRINKEFKVIADKDFSDYFLVLSDLVCRAKNRHTAVGWARGSAASSLIAYCLRITEIDPLTPPFDKMVFERFIDPTRSDAPDIDLDFDDEKRWETVQDAQEIYGVNNVANVANHTKYRGREALSGVARAHALPVKTFDAIGKRCAVRTETDERVDDSILDVVESYSANPEIRALLDSHGDCIKEAIALEGNQHSMGIHAGGFVIKDGSEPISEICPIYTREKGTGRNKKMVQVIPYDKRDAEYLNLLKMDFLGLTTMGMLGKIIEWGCLSLDEMYLLFYKELEDYNKHLLDGNRFRGNTWKAILRRFREDDVVGIFQFEGGTTRQLCKRLQPDTFDHLAAINALSRPGPYYGRGTDGLTQADAYCLVKNGEMDWERIHPNFDKHVEWTYGQIVYQEQIMFILRDVAGFDVPTVLRVRKIIGKKLGEHQFTELWEQFRLGCLNESGLSEDRALSIWQSITTAAGYAFNIAHAYSYSIIAWTQMWVKMRFPLEFFAASLYKNGDGKDDIPRRTALLQDAKKNNIEVGKFSPFSQVNWFYQYNYLTGNAELLPGLSQIPGIGIDTASDIVNYRDKSYEGWQVGEWDDLRRVSGIGPKTVNTIKTFTNQSDPFGITRTADQLAMFREQLVRGEFDETPIPSAEEFVSSSAIPQENDHVAFVGLVSNIIYRDEVETIRSRTGKSIEEIRSQMDNPESTKKATLFSYDEFGEVALRVSRWRYAALQERISNIKPDHHIVVAYGRTFDRGGNAIQVKTIWVLDPDE